MKYLYLILIYLFIASIGISQKGHPSLILTKNGVKDIKKNLDKTPIFKETYSVTKVEVDAWIASGINVPIPKDMSGGYTHEVHKRNFLMLQAAGNVFQISGEKRYAVHIHEVFKAYAAIYPTLEKHPATRSYARGKIFWQCLNDANWLVYASQAYDCIYESLMPSERTYLETQLFKPFADYISIDNPEFFNRIHNHSTWGNAAVGMIALVMDDEVRLDRALYGIKGMGAITGFDNDGSTIDVNQSAGFLAQLDAAFSPDGYYSEGPYYQRYAMSPFIMFAQALENIKPELEIFEYRDHLLKKALNTLLNLTDEKGQFFPINDAQKGMSFLSRELIAAVDVIYYYDGLDPHLPSIAIKQNKVQLDQTGMAIAKAIGQNKYLPFDKKSVQYVDGPDGKDGAVTILRSNKSGKEFACLFKYGVQGMGHGHFDRLGYSLYQGDTEILQDYGSARWVNIDQKSGGVYLKENQSYAKQTVAHNTMVINETSQFNGNTQQGDLHSSQSFYIDITQPQMQIVSAIDTHAYPGVLLQRTLLLVENKNSKHPILIDIFGAVSNSLQTVDLPFHFGSQLMFSSTDINVENTQLNVLGDKSGYQHIWKEGTCLPKPGTYHISWFTDGIFTTQAGVAEDNDEIIFARIGANDPEFNLRRDPMYIHRKKDLTNPLFINVIQCHGTYNPVEEVPREPSSPQVEITTILHDSEYTIAKIDIAGSTQYTVMIAHTKKSIKHSIEVNNKLYEWEQPIHVKTSKI